MGSEKIKHLTDSLDALPSKGRAKMRRDLPMLVGDLKEGVAMASPLRAIEGVMRSNPTQQGLNERERERRF